MQAPIRKVKAATRLAEFDPQASIKILAYASHHTMDYFYGVMPTNLVTDGAALFQKALEEGIDCFLAPEAYDIPECHVRRYERAHKVLRLPSRCGGANITFSTH